MAWELDPGPSADLGSLRGLRSGSPRFVHWRCLMELRAPRIGLWAGLLSAALALALLAFAAPARRMCRSARRP